MSEIERIIDALTAPAPAAAEVITLDRLVVECALTLLESHPDVAQGGLSLCKEVSAFRQALSKPTVQLWAIHSVGPGEEYPCLNREDAERRAQELRALGDTMKAERIARGESIALWNDWVTNVIPSPWEPAEHFEIMAEEWMEDADQLRQALIKLEDQREQLSAFELAVERWTLLTNEFKHTNPEHERELAEISKARDAIAKASQ